MHARPDTPSNNFSAKRWLLYVFMRNRYGQKKLCVHLSLFGTEEARCMTRDESCYKHVQPFLPQSKHEDTDSHLHYVIWIRDKRVFSHPSSLPAHILCVRLCIVDCICKCMFSYHECTHEHVHVCYAILPDKNVIGTFWALEQIWAILTFADTCWSTWSGSARPVDARMALRICSDIPGALWILSSKQIIQKVLFPIGRFHF